MQTHTSVPDSSTMWSILAFHLLFVTSLAVKNLHPLTICLLINPTPVSENCQVKAGLAECLPACAQALYPVSTPCYKTTANRAMLVCFSFFYKFLFFETGSLCATALAVLELTL